MAAASQAWGHRCFHFRARRAVPTTVAITTAWMAMLPKLNAPPKRSCRSMVLSLRSGGRDQVEYGRDDEVERQQLSALEPVGLSRRGNSRAEKDCPEQHPHLRLGKDQLELRLTHGRCNQYQHRRNEKRNLHAASQCDADAEIDPIRSAHGNGRTGFGRAADECKHN